MKNTAEVVRIKDVFAWVEDQRAIQLKAVAAGGKPVELSAEETRNLADRLMKLAQILETVQERAKRAAEKKD